MFLTVTLVRGDVSALVVSESAIVPDRSRQFVLVVGEDSVIERREVRLGRRRPGFVAITEGLKAGELVVVEGVQKALPGRPVRIISGVSAESRPSMPETVP